MENFNIIELKNISVVFDENILLENFNLCIQNGKFVTLLGPSGCGKTTILKLISGLLKPTKGSIFFNNKNITNIPPYKRNINTVFQRYALFPHLNVSDNVAFGLHIKNMNKLEIHHKVHEILKIVNLTGMDKRNIMQLSGGQQQRVAIARALINKPKVLLLDEPLSALDVKLKQQLQVELKEIQKKLNTTFVYVTHDQEEALALSDVLVVLNEGAIQQIGTPESVYNEPINAFVADFIGKSNIINGIMLDDYNIKFAGKEFNCVDKGFKTKQPVDVVIRPEDLKIVPKNEGKFSGVVDSIVFKGDYYEIEILAQEMYWLIKTTKFISKGTVVGLNFYPEDIHIMHKLFDQTTNLITAKVNNFEKLEFLGLCCDAKFINLRTHLKKNSFINLEIPPSSIKLVSYELADLILVLDTIIYKGAYNDMFFYYENGEESKYILVNSEYECEVGVEVGLKLNFSAINIRD